LQQERRSLVLPVKDLQYDWLSQGLALQFFLPPGSFATAVLRELCQLKQARETSQGSCYSDDFKKAVDGGTAWQK
jgi:tRNA pseudouridine13 synthase